MLISIITITVDSDETLRRTLESVAAQTYQDIEHIVVDGCPGERSAQIKADFPNVRFVFWPPRGIYDALNYGLSLSSGDIVGILHSGDVLVAPDRLQSIADTFSSNPECDYVYGDIQYLNPATGRRGRHLLADLCTRSMLSKGMAPPHPSLYMKRHVWKIVGPYPTDLPVAGDFEVWIRLFSRPDLRCEYIRSVIVYMQTGGVSTHLINRLFYNHVEKLKALRRNGIRSNLAMVACKPFIVGYDLLRYMINTRRQQNH